MTKLEADPRFEPVVIEGKTYITSHLLHRQKREAGLTKHQRHGHFMEMIENIDSYSKLADADHFKKLVWGICKKEGTENIGPLMKANSYNPILLLDATAQKEIEHFLDDEASKTSAANSSALAANPMAVVDAIPSDVLLSLALQKAGETIAAYENRFAHQDKALTTSQRRNAQLTIANKQLEKRAKAIEDYYSMTQYLKYCGIKIARNSKPLTTKLRKLADDQGVETIQRRLPGDKWASWVFPFEFLEDNYEVIEEFFK